MHRSSAVAKRYSDSETFPKKLLRETGPALSFFFFFFFLCAS
jgi:hypothetical protein